MLTHNRAIHETINDLIDIRWKLAQIALSYPEAVTAIDARRDEIKAVQKKLLADWNAYCDREDKNTKRRMANG